MTETPDMDRVAAIIRAVAAVEIMPRFQRLTIGQVREKGPGDLVTEADLAAEIALGESLTDLVPKSLVVGEEAASHHPKLLRDIAGEGPIWVVDPLDGTYNFAHGISKFTVIVALIRRAETVAGWIFDPIANRMASAAIGAGAWCEGERLTVAAPEERLEAMKGAIYARAGRPGIARDIREKRKRFMALSYQRCAGREHLALATGALHFALFTRLLPWDHAAGCLIHAEAGGYNLRLDGASYRPTVSVGNLLLAADKENWKALQAYLGSNE